MRHNRAAVLIERRRGFFFTMQSDAPTVDAYIDEAPEDRREALGKLRALCRTHLPGFEEAMVYGMAGYSRDGVVEVAFANQKNNLALYILRTDVLNPYRDRFAKSAIGKGCIRYTNPKKIDFDLVAEMLKQTARTRGDVC
jgi:uncharacterized protein YdhG (YjbR/CyaY superfamily)